MDKHPEALIIGGGVVDIPLRPVDKGIFDVGSYPLEGISMQVGGDAVNEAIILSRLGHEVLFSSKVGSDPAGRFIRDTLAENGVNVDCLVSEEGLDTGINIVLIREDGERSFITNRNGSLRRLAPEDILPALNSALYGSVKVVCLASLFVSPMLTVENTQPLFERIKTDGRILCADTTRRKNGETSADVADLLRYIDYFFPNLDEAKLLSGKEELDDIADDFLKYGVKNVVIKIGKRGCFLKNAHERHIIPAYPGTRCLDTTGAGDNFAAAFIAALLEGKSFAECGRYANAAASVCIESIGATVGIRNREIVDTRYLKMSVGV